MPTDTSPPKAAQRPVAADLRYSGAQPPWQWVRRLLALGIHTRFLRGILQALPLSLMAATLTWLVALVRFLPCRTQGIDPFVGQCYTDIVALYGSRGLYVGQAPYFIQGFPPLEYPVLTGGFIDLARRIAILFGAPTGPQLTSEQMALSTDIFYAVNIVLLFICYLITVYIISRTVKGQPWLALMVAISPTVFMTGLINWDMLPVALTAGAIWAWAIRRPWLVGVLLGLGCAAKLYPMLLLFGLFFLCIRIKQFKAFLVIVGTFVASWVLVNLPIALTATDQWMLFWTMNEGRAADFGSIWLMLQLFGIVVPNLNIVNAALLIISYLAIAVLIMKAPRVPNLGQIALLLVATFLILNKVYSPQYCLWLLPLVVLATPHWREWLVFTVGEVIYSITIWGWLGKWLGSGDQLDLIYAMSILLRVLTELWVVLMVVMDLTEKARAAPTRQIETETENPATSEATTSESAASEGVPAKGRRAMRLLSGLKLRTA